MAKKTEIKQIGFHHLIDDYMSYNECLKCLCIAKPTLQEHIRLGRIFTIPGDTIILPNGRRVFLKEAVKREIQNILRENGVR